MDTSIPALSNSCFKALKNICSRIERETTSDTELAQISRWQDELGRLRLWAANIGAHRTGQSSLEFRLKDSSHIRQQVTNLLLDLGRMFQEVEEVLDSLGNGQDHHMEVYDNSDDDYDTGEELIQLHTNIVTVINCLFQMSMLVRKPARHDFYMLPRSQEVLAFRPFDQAHVKEKYPAADERLLARLGLAITLRRQYLRYRERHHAKLNQDLDVGTEGSAAPTVMLSDTVVTGVEPWHIESRDEDSASEKSRTSYAPSMLAGGPLVIPPPPKESTGGAPFECPYCFIIISVDGIHAWHKHVFQDLQPYICTVADCSTPQTLFSTRHEWVQHLKEAHPHEWMGDEKQAAAPTNESITSIFCATCPLCKSNSKSEKYFVRHLARHLQELALFVVPQNDADSDMDDALDPEPLGKDNSETSVSSSMSPVAEHSNWDEWDDEQGDHDRLEGLEKPRGPESDVLEHELRPGRLIDSRPDSSDNHSKTPYQSQIGVSRQSGLILNTYFLPGNSIHSQVLNNKLCKYLGPEATSGPYVYKGTAGYVIKNANRPLTMAQLDDLQSLSRAYENELRERRRKRYPGILYEESEVYRSQDANLNYSDDTDMRNNTSYSPLPTPSGSTGGPERVQQLPPDLSSSSATNLTPYATPAPQREWNPIESMSKRDATS